MSTTKQCGCKGCRSCLMCEQISPNKLGVTEGVQTFLYLSTLGKAVCLKSSPQRDDRSYVGFRFEGVNIVEDFITKDEEAELVTNIDSSPWKESQSGRRKQDYGPKVNFKKKKVNASNFTGLPSYIQQVAVDKFKEIAALGDFQTVEQCNLEYQEFRGSAIDPHFDDSWLWGERLVTLNLLSDSWLTMSCERTDVYYLEEIPNEIVDPTIFTHLENSDYCDVNEISSNRVCVKIPLKRQSLVVLSGKARHVWKHAIQRKDISGRRLCCTFRELSNNFLKDTSPVGENLIKTALSFSGKVVL